MKALVGALALLATGVTIGILIAPDKGKKTRQKIGDRFDDVKDSWKKFRGASLDELDELKSTFKHEIAGLKDDARERVLELIKTARAARNNTKEEAVS
jgi:gas vesicle protein